MSLERQVTSMYLQLCCASEAGFVIQWLALTSHISKHA